MTPERWSGGGQLWDEKGEERGRLGLGFIGQGEALGSHGCTTRIEEVAQWPSRPLP